MPKTAGQWVGIAVTAIVVLGCNKNMALAMPLAIVAGALATFFVTWDEKRRLVSAVPANGK